MQSTYTQTICMSLRRQLLATTKRRPTCEDRTSGLLSKPPSSAEERATARRGARAGQHSRRPWRHRVFLDHRRDEHIHVPYELVRDCSCSEGRIQFQGRLEAQLLSRVPLGEAGPWLGTYYDKHRMRLHDEIVVDAKWFTTGQLVPTSSSSTP